MLSVFFLVVSDWLDSSQYILKLRTISHIYVALYFSMSIGDTPKYAENV